jgi:hypothetical protein
MTTQYTPILKLALPVQGELSGTWGDVVNENITSMLEEAIAGRSVINSWTTNAHVLSTADGTTAESRSAMLEFTDTGTSLTGAATVTCPALSKIYICKNDSGQQVTVTTAAGTGVDIPNGTTMIVFCDGTNVEEVVTNINTLKYNGYTVTFGGAVTTAGAFTTSGAYSLTLTATGATNVTLPTTGTLATLDGTETFTNKTFTSPTITSPTMTGTISATDLDITGDTTIGDEATDTLTITGTITSDLIFTDDTYDIGKSGATRPRNIYLSQDLVVGDNIAAASADITGAVGIDGDFDINSDKFTVTAASGNTSVAGTLGVTGNATFSGQVITDTINEATATNGVIIDGVTLKDGEVTTDTINEDTADTGVTVDGVLLKDGGATFTSAIDVTGTVTADGLTVEGSLGNLQLQASGAELHFSRDGNNDLLANGGSSADLTVGAKNVLKIKTGTGFTERLRIDTSGNVTINETGTDADFRVESDTSTHALFVQGSDGFVGIGTSSPSGKLVVRRDIDGDNPIGFENLATTAGSSDMTHTLDFRFNRTGSGQNLSAAKIRVGKEREWIGAASNQDGYLAFFTTANETSAERMRITSGGSVGIGTDSPIGSGMTLAEGKKLYVNHNESVRTPWALSGNNTLVLSRRVSGVDTNYHEFTHLQHKAPDGQFNYPSFSFMDDVDTGMYSPSADALGFSTGGAERMHINSSGNVTINDGGNDSDFRVESDDNTHTLFVEGSTDRVGIRYSNPQTELNLSGTFRIGQSSDDYYMDFSNNSIQFNRAGSSYIDQKDDNGALAFRITSTSGIETLKMNSSGSVFNDNGDDLNFRVESSNNDHALFVDGENGRIGMGTTPAVKLDVYGPKTSPSEVRITIGGGTWNTDDEHGRYSFYTTDGSSNGAHETASIRSINDYGSADTVQTSGALTFYTSDYNSTSQERMRIDSSGVVNMLGSIRVGGLTEAAADSAVSCGQVNLRNTYTPSGSRFQLDCEGVADTQNFVTYWYDGVGYRNRMAIAGNASETSFNDSSQNIDFRVESDSNTHALFVDAANSRVGINSTASANTDLTIGSNDVGMTCGKSKTFNTWQDCSATNTHTLRITFSENGSGWFRHVVSVKVAFGWLTSSTNYGGILDFMYSSYNTVSGGGAFNELRSDLLNCSYVVSYVNRNVIDIIFTTTSSSIVDRDATVDITGRMSSPATAAWQ